MPEKLISGMCKAAVSVDRIGQVMKAEEKRDEAGEKIPRRKKGLARVHEPRGKDLYNIGSFPLTSAPQGSGRGTVSRAPNESLAGSGGSGVRLLQIIPDDLRGHVAEDPKKYIRTYFAVMERIEKAFDYYK